jgi:hypothetical protein
MVVIQIKMEWTVHRIVFMETLYCGGCGSSDAMKGVPSTHDCCTNAPLQSFGELDDVGQEAFPVQAHRLIDVMEQIQCEKKSVSHSSSHSSELCWPRRQVLLSPTRVRGSSQKPNWRRSLITRNTSPRQESVNLQEHLLMNVEARHRSSSTTTKKSRTIP